MYLFSKEKGFTLIEVLVSIILLSLLFVLIGQYFVKSYEWNAKLNQEYTSLQLCESLLEKYKSKEFSELEQYIDKTESIDIADELNLPSPEDISDYQANFRVSHHIDTSLEDRLLIVTITVSNRNENSPVSLGGFVRR